VIFAGILVWAIATIGSALSGSYAMLLFFRALVGVGEGAYGPVANALLCADAPPEKRGRALGIYNVGMALGGTAGLALGTTLSPIFGWRGVFWLAGGPSLLPARAYLLRPTYIIALLGGILATYGASALISWSRVLIVEERHFTLVGGSIFMGIIGILCGAGGVIAGGYAGDALSRRAHGGHALAIGLSMLAALPIGVASLLIMNKPAFMVLTTLSVFFLSVYNGPSAAVVDELGPQQFAATLQAVFMFGIHVLGNAPAPLATGWVADRSTVSMALQLAMAAFGLSGVAFVIVARRQRRAGRV
jgi:predicted MFS family arabinose efflux permease